MKIFKIALVTVTSFLLFFSQSTYAVYGTDDVPDDVSEKTVTHYTEVEVNEFVLLDVIPNIELYYYPYSATDADVNNSEDVPGGAGSVFVGGGVIKWHTNVNTTISIDDFTLTNTDTSIDQLNEISDSALNIHIDSWVIDNAAAHDSHTFDNSHGSAVEDMSSDMTAAYNLRENDNSSTNFSANNGSTDFVVKYYLAVSLGEAGSVQSAGTYVATATIRVIPTVSN